MEIAFDPWKFDHNLKNHAGKWIWLDHTMEQRLNLTTIFNGMPMSNPGGRAYPVLCVEDVKLRILEEFPNEVLIQKSSVSSRNQEYVFSVSVTLTPDVLAACSSGFGLSKTATLHSAANRLHHDLIKTRSKRPYPPTPKDIKGKVNTEKNFLVFLISDRSSEMMKVSKRKCVKILNTY